MEQIVDMRITLRFLWVILKKKSYIFGDNKSFVDSSLTPHSKIYKRNMSLLFHRVIETIAAGIISYNFVQGSLNLDNMLSKYWLFEEELVDRFE